MNDIRQISIKQIEANKGQIDGLPRNPRTIKDARFEALKKSIEDAPEMLNLRELLVFPHNDKFVVIGGNMRLKACKDLGFKELPCKVLDENTPVEKLREYAIKDNIAFGDDDWDTLKTEWDKVEVEDWGMIWQSEDERVINNYSRKIEVPTYEPNPDGADLDECLDLQKYSELIKRIETANVLDKEKEFLRLSATRHIVFDYAKIGDYYAQATAEMQSLMEDSALVIIDFKKAIEKGFVKLSETLAELYGGGSRMKDFVVFILSHGRADNVITYRTLQRAGYTGRIVIVIDDEDEQMSEYIDKFGTENVAIFSKSEEAKHFDEIIRGDRRTIVYARNACFGIAERLGYRFFLELDDDYSFFGYNVDNEFKWVTRTMNCSNLDDVFSAILDYFKKTPIMSIALSQGGDFIGGAEHLRSISLTRKCMNSFFCDTKRPFKFQGRINEDVNTYTTLATRGAIFFTIMQFSLNQKTTQSNKGGMTDVYLDSGTYLKSFFTIITHPSGCKVALMGGKNKRLHHSIAWNNTAPKIINEKYKKYER